MISLFKQQFDQLPPSNPATIDLARALPTLSVVFGSRRGGIGAGNLPASVIFLGSVAHCLAEENCCCCCFQKQINPYVS